MDDAAIAEDGAEGNVFLAIEGGRSLLVCADYYKRIACA